MSISFQCTGCGRTLKVADELAGRKAKCPQCQAVLYIPEGPAAAVTPAPAAGSMPARRRPAPVTPPQEELEDPGDEPEERERRPRRRKKAKKSMLVPVLIAVAAGVLLLGGVTVAAFFVVPMLFGGGASEDLYFMPDNTQMVGQVRADQILNSDALKQVWSAFPDAKAGFDKATSQSSGIAANDVDRMYFGASSTNFGAKDPPAAIAVLHFKNSVKVEDLEAGIKKGGANGMFTMNYTFTDTKVGKYTMTEVKSSMTFPPQPGMKNPLPAPPPTTLYCFTMPNDKEVVMGASSALQAVLTRDKKPEINDKLQAAIKQTDFNASVAFAANVKEGFPQAAAAGPSNPLPTGKVDGLSASIKIGSDVDVNVVALCQDATAAGELSGGLKTAIAQGKKQYGALVPPELADLMNIEPQVSGSNVTISKTIKVAPLIAMAKNQQKGAGFNPLGMFNPFGK